MKSRLRSAGVAVCLVGVFVLGFALGTGRHSDATAGMAAAQPSDCSAATLNGSFGVRFEGATRAFGRFASVSLWTFEGQGTVLAAEHFTSEVQNGSRTIRGTYRVEPDCTWVLTFPSELAREHEAEGLCVVVDGGKEFYCLDNEEGWVALGVGKKM